MLLIHIYLPNITPPIAPISKVSIIKVLIKGQIVVLIALQPVVFTVASIGIVTAPITIPAIAIPSADATKPIAILLSPILVYIYVSQPL